MVNRYFTAIILYLMPYFKPQFFRIRQMRYFLQNGTQVRKTDVTELFPLLEGIQYLVL